MLHSSLSSRVFSSVILSSHSHCCPFATSTVPKIMRGFWTRSSSSSPDSTSESLPPPLPPPLPPAEHYPKAEIDSVSVKPAPAPIKALSTPLPSRWLSISSDRSGTETAIDLQEQPSPTTPTETPQTSSASSHPSPRLEHSPLPNLPFVPSPDQNPSLTGSTQFKADPSSILLSYPRSNVDHVHDFYGLYNPPESKIWGMTRYGKQATYISYSCTPLSEFLHPPPPCRSNGIETNFSNLTVANRIFIL